MCYYLVFRLRNHDLFQSLLIFFGKDFFHRQSCPIVFQWLYQQLGFTLQSEEIVILQTVQSC